MALKKKKKILKKNPIVALPKAKPKDFKSRDVQARGYYAIILFLMLVFIDRIGKIWATNKNIDYGIFAITYTTNTGAGFSILQDMNILLVIVSIIALGLIIYYHKHIPKFSSILLISGIASNVIDRIFYGAVIDFINLKFWPIFNIADSLVFIGVVWWIIILLKKGNKEDEKKNSKK